jgi:UDP-N-acetyl-D-mannosaminuronate dehydrogenase
MKIGMVGLGKLGLPCLLAMEKFGSHEVYGFDISQNVIDSIESKKVNYWEAGVNELLQESKIKVVPKVFLEVVFKVFRPVCPNVCCLKVLLRLLL